MKKVGIVALIFYALNCNAIGLQKACDNKAYQVADAKLVSASASLKKSNDPWTDLASVFKTWEPCLDKFQDESFIDVIADLAATRWEKISDLINLKSNSPTFYKYIISSLGNETVGLERRKKIVSLSQKQCPTKAKEICKDIEKADQVSRN